MQKATFLWLLSITDTKLVGHFQWLDSSHLSSFISGPTTLMSSSSLHISMSYANFISFAVIEYPDPKKLRDPRLQAFMWESEGSRILKLIVPSHPQSRAERNKCHIVAAFIFSQPSSFFCSSGSA